MKEMSMTAGMNSEPFIQNRAELLPDDIWGNFIVPPLFNRHPIFLEKKALRIRGGRGCGKTMFIRYLCHQTRFSKNRKNIPAEEFQWIGLYWLPDTQFCGMMKASWLGEQDAQLAFLHYATLVIVDELARCFDSIAVADLQGGVCDVRDVELTPTIKKLLGGKGTTIRSLKEVSELERAELELWLQNPKTYPRPLMLRFDSLLDHIGALVAKADSRLQNVFFRIFVDEFENLQEGQRRLVCDFVKHKKNFFNVNFAMRQHAITKFQTSGVEQIVEGHDVRTIDIERNLAANDGRDFELVAAEFLLLGLTNSGYLPPGPDFDPQKLFDVQYLQERNSNKYRSMILAKARQVLPGMSAKDIAQTVLQDKPLSKRLRDMIEKGLRLHNERELKVDDFILPSHPEASIVAGAVLNRSKPGPRVVFEQLELLKGAKAKESSFLAGSLIENNLYGCLFYLYIGLPLRANLLYAGFDRFCALASPNLRFFQELCRVAYQLARNQADVDGSNTSRQITPTDQATAAEEVGEIFLLEIERLGLQGTQLLEVMRRLGSLFEAAQRRPSQSEVEINHFSIDESDRVALSEETRNLITQAKIWSVFYEEQDTKNKSNYDLAQTDIIPNPIFSPYFGISYRKKKKITLSAAQVNTIMTGDGSQFDAILREYSERWRSGDDIDSPQTPGLF